jgi:hypothetical protein
LDIGSGDFFVVHVKVRRTFGEVAGFDGVRGWYVEEG